MSEKLLESLFEGVYYHWNCAHCENINEEEEDVRGQEVICGFCNKKSIVVGS